MIELYHADMSTCAQKVRLALAEKELPWVGHLLNLRKSDQHRPEYLKLNPNGVVPTLVDDRRVIIESTVICEYLDDAYPDPPMRPSTPYGQARMRLWTKRLDEGLHFHTGVLSGSIAFRHQHLTRTPAEQKAYIAGIPDPARRERQRQQLELGIDAPQFAPAIAAYGRFLADMERTLADSGPWLAGETYSLADVGYTPYIIRLDELNLWGWMDRRPHITGWYERIKARPNFQAGYVDWRNDDYVILMKEKGAETWPRIRQMIAAL